MASIAIILILISRDLTSTNFAIYLYTAVMTIQLSLLVSAHT